FVSCVIVLPLLCASNRALSADILFTRSASSTPHALLFHPTPPLRPLIYMFVPHKARLIYKVATLR
ncbi:MAG: hypothetical protein NTV35_10040, partial [Chloroflexi bacterium]|nr:hypothetical protein [Chloroflexota bacterium]